MDAKQVLLLGIALNVTAGIGALAFAFLEDRIGAKTTVLTALACLTVLGSRRCWPAPRRSSGWWRSGWACSSGRRRPPAAA